MLVLGDLASPM